MYLTIILNSHKSFQSLNFLILRTHPRNSFNRNHHYVVWVLTKFLKVQNVDFGMGYHFSPKLNKNVPKGIIKQKN